MKIILLGSFAGNNAGDMVILESIITDFNSISEKSDIRGNISQIDGLSPHMKLEIVVPSLNEKGFEFVQGLIDLRKEISIVPIPIDKNPKSIILTIIKLFKEFLEADYIYTTAGILFDHKIWNPLYNFVVVYTPFMILSKVKNKSKVIGYNVGVTSSSKFIGAMILKKCIKLHDVIFLRENRDAEILKKIGYTGKIVESVDNVFGYKMPSRKINNKNNRIFINITLCGVKNVKRFTMEMLVFIASIKDKYEICFLQTSKRDLKIAREICEKSGLSEQSIYYTALMGYDKVQELLQSCHILMGMRMHSIIFALKGSCPIIGINYSSKVTSLMYSMGLDKYLVDINGFTKDDLLKKIDLINIQYDKLTSYIFDETQKRYFICNRYK